MCSPLMLGAGVRMIPMSRADSTHCSQVYADWDEPVRSASSLPPAPVFEPVLSASSLPPPPVPAAAPAPPLQLPTQYVHGPAYT